MKFVPEQELVEVVYRGCTAMVFAGILIVGGCSSSDGGGTDPVVDPIVGETSTADLQLAAATNIGRNFSVSLDGANNVSSQNSSIVVVSPLGSLLDGDLSATDGIVPDTTVQEQEAMNLLDTTLGLDDDSTAVVSRIGNRITIDPDEDKLCAEELVNSTSGQSEFERCKSLMSDVMVQLDATSDTAGSVTYLFRNQPLIVIQHAPDSESIEINLGTFKTLADASDLLNPDAADTGSSPNTLVGALRFASTVTSTQEDAEAGSLSVEVSQPLSIIDAAAGSEFSMGAGTLFSMFVDAGTNSGQIEFDVGTVQAISSSNERLSKLDLSGFTGTIDLAGDSKRLIVSNLGIGRGPLTYSVDSEEALRLTLETFGFTVQGDNGEMSINGNMNINMLIDEMVGADPDETDLVKTMLQISAPDGTQLLDQLNGSTKVTAGGPLSYSFETTTQAGGSTTGSVQVGEGQCVDDSEDDLVLVECDLE